MEKMIDNSKKTSLIDQVRTLFENKFKTIIYIILAFIFIIIIFQYYFYQKEKKILELSIMYNNAKSNVDINRFNEQMNLIAKKNGIFSIMASLDLIEKNLDNKDYNLAFNEYLKILKNNESKRIYNSIIALHAAYNLIDYVSSDNIINLLTFIDKSNNEFIGYKNEIEFLLSIKNNDISKREELTLIILNNDIISETIKERVRKINEFEKYQ